MILPSLTALGGGIELYLQQFLTAFVREWPDFSISCILARESESSPRTALTADVSERLHVSGSGSGDRYRRLFDLARNLTAEAIADRPDLIVCGHVNYAAMCWMLARRFGVPWCVLTYGLEAWDLKGINAKAIRSADCAMAISRFTAERLVSTTAIERNRVAIVHNAVDIERFKPAAPAPSLVAALADLPRPRLLTVCRLDGQERYKGVDQVIEAMARYSALAGSYLVVGDGTDRPRLERLAAERRIPIKFWGRASDEELPDLYRACDLFVMPSRREGFGYVFIEAMACGVPVVAGGIDGSVDALADGALGVLVDPSSIDDIARGIRAQLAGDTSPDQRSPSALHAAVDSRFSHKAFQRQLSKALSPLVRA